jgi:hypothetical protein
MGEGRRVALHVTTGRGYLVNHQSDLARELHAVRRAAIAAGNWPQHSIDAWIERRGEAEAKLTRGEALEPGDFLALDLADVLDAWNEREDRVAS